MNACRYWRVHIGAHKTATTHFQDCLAEVSPQLLDLDCGYITREAFRQAGGLPRIPPSRRLLRAIGLPVAALPPRHWLNLQASQTETLLLSEENILGGVSGLFSRSLYPRAEYGLERLRKLAGGAEISIFLSIRSLSSLLPSAYAQRCRFGRSLSGDFERVRHAALLQPMRWAAFVDRVTRLFAPSDITIWRFEDYIRNPEPYLAAFCGTSTLTFTSRAAPASTRSPSADAIRATEQLDPLLPRKIREEAAMVICERDEGQERFQPFSAEEADMLTRAYEQDIAAIRSAHPEIRFC